MPAPRSYALLRSETDPVTANEIEVDLSTKAYAKAEEVLFARAQRSAHPKVLLEILGGVLFLDSKYLDSAIAFKKAEKNAPLSESAQFTLAMSYVKLKRNAWARDELLCLRKEGPKQPLYLYWLGRLDYNDQRFVEAKLNFEQALNADSHFVRAYDGLGLCDEAMGDMNAAEQAYKNGNRLNRQKQKQSAWLPLDYGAMLRKGGRYPEARMLLKEALTIDHSLAEGYYELGRLEESLSNREAAIKDLSKAALLDPTDPSAVYSLFRLYKQAGEANRAATMLARFRRLKQQADTVH
jgi:tetratricopeptide (TPR) repeat protein